MKTLRLYLLALLALTAGACNRTSEKETETRRNLVYGIDAVDQVASRFSLLLGGAVAGSRRQREQCEEV